MQLPWRERRIHGGTLIGTSMTGREVSYLRSIVHGAVLEVGSAFGFSAIAMARSPRVEHVLAVDPHGGRLHGAPEVQDSLTGMRRNLAAYKVEDRVSIMLAPSQLALPLLWRLGARFDFIFIDGDHSREAVWNDVRWAQVLRTRLAAIKAIAVHDVGEDTCPDVGPVTRELLGEPVELVDTLGVW